MKHCPATFILLDDACLHTLLENLHYIIAYNKTYLFVQSTLRQKF